jgi:hypothetical protein
MHACGGGAGRVWVGWWQDAAHTHTLQQPLTTLAGMPTPRRRSTLCQGVNIGPHTSSSAGSYTRREALFNQMALTTTARTTASIARRSLLPSRASRSSLVVRAMSKQVISTDKAPAALGPYR